MSGIRRFMLGAVLLPALIWPSCRPPDANVDMTDYNTFWKVAADPRSATAVGLQHLWPRFRPNKNGKTGNR